jgi:drug/metabolite transporter (DMT)-like permease
VLGRPVGDAAGVLRTDAPVRAEEAARGAEGLRVSVRRSASARRVWLALITVYIAWGSTYVAIRVMDRTAPPLIAAGVRFVLAGAAMYAFIAVRRGRLLRVNARELASLTLVAMLLLAGGNGLVTYAERRVPAGLAALLVASMPLWLLVIRSFTRDRPRRATLIGLAVGFVGVGLLVSRGNHGGVSVPHMLIVVLGALSWALGSWASARLPLPEDAATGTAIEMLIGGAALAVIGPLAGEHWSALFAHASADAWIAIVYLALFGSILAFTTYVWLLQNAPISQISTYAYINPIVAVGLGTLILGEAVTPIMVLGGAIIVVAVAVVIRAETRTAPQIVGASP